MNYGIYFNQFESGLAMDRRGLGRLRGKIGAGGHIAYSPPPPEG